MFLSALNKFLTFFLLTGTVLMLTFIVLSGSVDAFPFNRFYWLQADTSAFTEAGADVTRWTFWGICNPSSYNSSAQGICSGLGPAVAISPADNWGYFGLPDVFMTNATTYYYLSRFAFASILVSLGFSTVALINSVLSPWWSAMKEVNFVYTFIAMIFAMAGAACGTSVSILVRNNFTDAGSAAKIQASVMGMLWASVACLTIIYFLSCCSASNKVYKMHKAHQREINHAQATQEPAPAADEFQAPVNEGSGIRFFKIRKNQQEKTDEESVV